MNPSENKQAITNFNLKQLTEVLSVIGKQGYRAKQIFRWLYKRKVSSFAEMTDLSKVLRAHLEENFYIPLPKITAQHDSESDGSRKFLFEMGDTKTVETVLIPAKGRLTQCVSSQVGCAMGCNFCNTGDMGLMRNLKAHEIVDQVLGAARSLEDSAENLFGHALSNIVFMGMGEPFHNLESVITAIEILTDENGLNLSHRKITVSTSGLVPQIAEFGSRTKANLAISLNATTDEVRTSIMPINKRWPLAELLQACREYPLGPTRRITFEYVMLKDINDSMEDVKRIPRLLNNIPSKVNLIPFNAHDASEYKRPQMERVYAFQKYLLNKNFNTTVRISKGQDILAACGQLRSSKVASRFRNRLQKQNQVNAN